MLFYFILTILMKPSNCYRFAITTASKEDLLRFSLSQCVSSASGTYIDKGDVILYSIPITEHDPEISSSIYLSHLIIPDLTQNWPVFVRNNLNNVTGKNKRPCKNYIIQIRNVLELNLHLQALSGDTFWNPHAKFLIISATVFNDPIRVASDLLKQLWQFHVLNGVVFLVNRFNQTLIDVYTWFPFDYPNCGRNFSKIVHIDSCSFGIITNKTNWFEFLPKRFHDCEISVRIIEAPPFIINIANNSYNKHNNLSNKGLEINLLDVVAEQLDLKIRYISSDINATFGDVLSNGTITGNLQYLETSSDLAIGHYAKTYERSLKFDASIDYFQESLHWCVPHQPSNNFDNLTKVITREAWIVILVTYILISTLTWFTATDQEPKSYSNLSTCFLNSFAILLGIAIGNQAKSTRVRFFLGLLMLISFCILSTYQTLEISVLSNKDYKEKIQTVSDIFENNLKIYLPIDSRRYFEDYHIDDNEMNLILENWNDCHDLEYCFNRVALHRDSAVCSPKSYQEYILNSFIDNNKENLIYCFRKAVVTYPINILLRKGSPFYESINRIISNSLNAGLIAKWEADIMQNRYKNITVLTIGTEYVSSTLNLFSLKPIFCLLLIGYCAAISVFVLEIMVHKSYHKLIVKVLVKIKRKPSNKGQ